MDSVTCALRCTFRPKVKKKEGTKVPLYRGPQQSLQEVESRKETLFSG